MVSVIGYSHLIRRIRLLFWKLKFLKSWIFIDEYFMLSIFLLTNDNLHPYIFKMNLHKTHRTFSLQRPPCHLYIHFYVKLRPCKLTVYKQYSMCITSRNNTLCITSRNNDLCALHLKIILYVHSIKKQYFMSISSINNTLWCITSRSKRHLFQDVLCNHLLIIPIDFKFEHVYEFQQCGK